jgi:DNA polymerase III subunit delta'
MTGTHSTILNRLLSEPPIVSMWQTIGHEWAIELLQHAVARQRVAHTYLFTGPANTGKTHLALELAAALNCMGAAPPCGSCRACSQTALGTHPDVMLIEPDGDKLKIDQMRAAQRELALSPYEGRWRVCIITEFQAATLEAANALLKTLEEPASRVVIILTATDASLLLPTIISRCQLLPLRAVPIHKVKQVLVERWHKTEDEAQVLARLSAGRIGWAIRAAQDRSVLAQRKHRLEELVSICEVGRAARIQAAERLSKRDDLPEALRLWQTWWRDVMLAGSGCEDLVVNLDYLETVRQYASRYDVPRAEAAVRSTESALLELEQNANPRLALEVLFLNWYRTSRVQTRTEI